jgi:hypothetical protein
VFTRRVGATLQVQCLFGFHLIAIVLPATYNHCVSFIFRAQTTMAEFDATQTAFEVSAVVETDRLIQNIEKSGIGGSNKASEDLVMNGLSNTPNLRSISLKGRCPLQTELICKDLLGHSIEEALSLLYAL